MIWIRYVVRDAYLQALEMTPDGTFSAVIHKRCHDDGKIRISNKRAGVRQLALLHMVDEDDNICICAASQSEQLDVAEIVVRAIDHCFQIGRIDIVEEGWKRKPLRLVVALPGLVHRRGKGRYWIQIDVAVKRQTADDVNDFAEQVRKA